MEGLGELPSKSNYFIGNDPKKWYTNVPTYAKVKYPEVYPGVDLVYYGNQRQLEYDFVVAPGADPKIIQLAFEGADRMETDPQGDLILHTAVGDVRLRKPQVYQEINGIRQAIPGSYILLPQSLGENRDKGVQRVRFEVAAYDVSKPLIIDPVLVYSTYLGGSGFDQGYGIAVDAAGNAYVTGFTSSANFPTANPLQPTFDGSLCQSGLLLCSDAFVAKLDATGSTLIYSTYLGGNHSDEGTSIAVDTFGNAYVTGLTRSSNFPTTPGAFQLAFSGGLCSLSGGDPGPPPDAPCPDVFVTKLSANGSALIYSTYLGGSNLDEGKDIAVDTSGSAYVTGATFSADFPTVTPSQPAFGSGGAFVAKLNSAGSTLVYSTYLDGSDSLGIAVDTSGSAYVTGTTFSTNFPILNPLQATCALDSFGACNDAFVAKLNSTGSTFVYSTYLGGNGSDFGSSIAVDTLGNAYVTGFTSSTNFPTANPLQAVCDESFPEPFCGDAFVVKLNATGSALVYSTYLGGSLDDQGSGIAVDTFGNAYVTGSSNSKNFPTTDLLQPALGDFVYAPFVTKLNSTGSAVVYSIRFGGTNGNFGFGIAVDTSGNAYVIGNTLSTDFPTVNPLQANCASNNFDVCGDAFIAKIAPGLSVPLADVTDFNGDGKADIAVYRSSTGEWFAIGSSVRSFGSPLDIPTPGDYNGDGVADFAFFRPSTGEWQVLLIGVEDVQTWGIAGDIPVPGDYDGDKKTDRAVWRPATTEWWILLSGGGISYLVWGERGDTPIPADYDGDGKDDVAVWRPSTGQWFILNSSEGLKIQVLGKSGDFPVPGDYDGDGKANLATWNSNTGIWTGILKSGKKVSKLWGIPGDLPVQADYDGDGKTDLGIFRSSSGQWFILTSSSGFTISLVTSWGLPGDIPVAASGER